MPCNVSVRGAFQLTPSARRATAAGGFQPRHEKDFNPRPPRGGRRGDRERGALQRQISINALRKEGDLMVSERPSLWWQFQSTPSARRATIAKIREQDTDSISIHALREEGDAASAMTPLHTGHFNPRSPWGERPKVPSTPSLALSYFNPRPPRGGRPGHSFDHFRVVQISIHALREEGDLRFNFRWSMLAKFQSTPSARRATAKAAKKSATFVPLYTLVHNLKRNFTKAPAKCKTKIGRASCRERV